MSPSLLNRLETSVVLVYVEYSIDWTISRPLTAVDRHEETLLASRRRHSVIGSTKLPNFYDRSAKVDSNSVFIQYSPKGRYISVDCLVLAITP